MYHWILGAPWWPFVLNIPTNHISKERGGDAVHVHLGDIRVADVIQCDGRHHSAASCRGSSQRVPTHRLHSCSSTHRCWTVPPKEFSRVIESETHARIYRHLVLNPRTCSAASVPPVHITHVEGTVEFYYYSRGSVEGTRWLPESAPTHQLNRKLSESNSGGKIGTEAA